MGWTQAATDLADKYKLTYTAVMKAARHAINENGAESGQRTFMVDHITFVVVWGYPVNPQIATSFGAEF